MCHFVLVFFSPFSIAITSLGDERANLCAFRTFVRFILVCSCRFPLPLGVWEGLRFMIVSLPGLFSYLFLGLLMGKFRQILTELSARDMPIFSFLDDNLIKRKWIFTKLGMCIDIVEIWIGIANGQISSNFDAVIYWIHAHIFVSGR